MIFSEAMGAVATLVECYPNVGKSVSEGYLGALASLLADYPKSVSLLCCDPIRGIPRESRFLPTIADIVAWCEKRTDALRGRVDREDRVAVQLTEREATAAHDASRRLTYDELKAKYGDGQGDWGLNAERRSPWKPPSAEQLRAEIGDEAWDKLPTADKNSWQQLPKA